MRPRKDGTPSEPQSGNCKHCSKPAVDRNMCNGHAARWRRSANPLKTAKGREPYSLGPVKLNDQEIIRLREIAKGLNRRVK